MRLIALAVALLFTLTACEGSNPTVAEVQDLITKGCNLTVKAGDLAAVIAAVASPGSGPVINSANSIAKAVCGQWMTKKSTGALTSTECVAVVNGVCVRKEK